MIKSKDSPPPRKGVFFVDFPLLHLFLPYIIPESPPPQQYFEMLKGLLKSSCEYVLLL